MEKVVILCGLGGRPSMKKVFAEVKNTNAYLVIRKELKKSKGYIFEVYSKDENGNITMTKTKNIDSLLDKSYLIKWGNRIQVDDLANVVYNNSSAVKNASVKSLARKLFAENEIPCPLNITPQTDRSKVVFPIIGRPLLHHQGKNFYTFNTWEEFLAHYNVHKKDHYYSNFVPKVKEFRAHVAHSKILALLEKPRPEDPNQIVWNHAQNAEAWTVIGWDDYGKFGNLREGAEPTKNDLRLARACVGALNALGLDFGAVDVVVTEDGSPYVLEVNTAPELSNSEYAAAKYSKYFDWIGAYNLEEGEDNKREHWSSLEYMKSKSFSWKKINFRQND